MSKDETFTHIGAETNKIISRILRQYSRDNRTIQNYTKKQSVLCNDNADIRNWQTAKQLNLFEHAVGG